MRHNSFGLTLLFWLTGSIAAHAAPPVWDCVEGTYWSDDKPVLIQLNEPNPEAPPSAPENKYGFVTASGSRMLAIYRVVGINRRWDFGDMGEDGSLPYAIVMRPTGLMSYFDFSTAKIGEKISASQSYFCRPKQP